MPVGSRENIRHGLILPHNQLSVPGTFAGDATQRSEAEIDYPTGDIELRHNSRLLSAIVNSTLQQMSMSRCRFIALASRSE